MNKLKWNAGQIVNDINEYELAQYPATDKPKYLVDYDFKDMEIARLNKIIDDIKNVIEEKNLWIYVDEKYNYPYIAVKNLEDILFEPMEEGKE